MVVSYSTVCLAHRLQCVLLCSTTVGSSTPSPLSSNHSLSNFQVPRQNAVEKTVLQMAVPRLGACAIDAHSLQCLPPVDVRLERPGDV